MGAEQTIHGLPPGNQGGFEGIGDLSDISADASTKQKPLDLSSLIRVVQRNILLIAGITAGSIALAAVAITREAPSYQGNFQMLVEPITSQARSADPSAISRDRVIETDSVDYPTLLQVLQSPQILTRIAKEIQTKYPEISAASLQQDIQNQALLVKQPGTNLTDSAKVIEVIYSGGDPQKVQFILEKLKDGYLRYSLEDRKTRIGGGIQFIEDQLPGLQQRVNSLEAEMQALKQRYRISNPETEGSAISTQLQETRNARLQAQRDLAEQQTLYNTLQRQLNLTPAEALAAASLSENPRYQELLTQLKKVEAQIAVKEARFKEDSPVIKALRDQQRELTQLLYKEAQENLQQSEIGPSGAILAFQNPTRLELIKQFVTTANTRQVLQVRTQAVSQAEAFLDQRQQQFPSIVRQYNDLNQRLEIATRTLNQFLTQRETLRIEAAQKEVPWEVISPPAINRDAAGNPASVPTKSTRTLAMGVAGGALLGIAAALLREKSQNVFFDTRDIVEALSPPLLGSVPYRADNARLLTPSLTSADPFAKAFNSLYTNIRFLATNPPIRSLTISSAGKSDGKTTTAMNLALAAAAMGQRVLIVDANLRSPHIHTLLGVTNSLGLSEMLRDNLPLGAVVQCVAMEKKLSVLTAGQALSDSIRFLASSEMRTLAQQLQADYDLVIYDTPDLTEFPDANFLSTYTDGIVLVVGVGKTKRTVVSTALAEIDRFRLRVLGIVANHTGKNVATTATTTPPYQTYGGQPAILENLQILKSDVSTPSTKQ